MSETIQKTIKEAKDKVFLAHFGGSENINKLSPRLPDLKAQKEEIDFALANLFGAEAKSKRQLSEASDNIDAAIEAISCYREIGDRYPVLSLEPLTWRDKTGCPKLAIVHLNDSGFELKVHSGKATFPKSLPEEIKGCYKDVVKLMLEHAREEERIHWQTTCRITLTSELKDIVLPRGTREKILSAQDVFSDDIYLITEPIGWTFKKTAIPDPDPLVVGWKSGQLWLIDVFDLTPLEKLVTCEFTSG